MPTKAFSFDIPIDLYVRLQEEKQARFKASPDKSAFLRDVIIDAIKIGLPLVKEERIRKARS